jgi:hypothetical protein
MLVAARKVRRKVRVRSFRGRRVQPIFPTRARTERHRHVVGHEARKLQKASRVGEFFALRSVIRLVRHFDDRVLVLASDLADRADVRDHIKGRIRSRIRERDDFDVQPVRSRGRQQPRQRGTSFVGREAEHVLRHREHPNDDVPPRRPRQYASTSADRPRAINSTSLKAVAPRTRIARRRDTATRSHRLSAVREGARAVVRRREVARENQTSKPRMWRIGFDAAARCLAQASYGVFSSKTSMVD